MSSSTCYMMMAARKRARREDMSEVTDIRVLSVKQMWLWWFNSVLVRIIMFKFLSKSEVEHCGIKRVASLFKSVMEVSVFAHKGNTDDKD